MSKSIAFIINPHSGNASKWPIEKLIAENLDFKLYTTHEIVFTEAPKHANKLSKKFVERGFDIVVAVGGDGTVNEVASALIHTSTALGVISTGSGNGLARHMKIPQNFVKAVKLLNFSEEILIDYGLVNEDKPFFCTCGTGFDAYVSELFAQGGRRGKIGYIEKMLSGYLNYKREPYTLINEADGINFSGKAFVITFANASQWGNNAYIAPNASVQDGLLDISVIADVPIAAIPTIAFQLFTKTIKEDLLVTTLKTKKICLQRERAGAFHLDGEPIVEGDKIEIRIVENGLRMMVAKRF